MPNQDPSVAPPPVVESAAAEAEAADSKRQGVALALSGGGFRASIFHMGALWRLHELGVLGGIRTFSGVSGGSIFAGYLADRAVRQGGVTDQDSFGKWTARLDCRRDLAEGLRRFVSRDFRTWLFLKHALWNWAFPRFRAEDAQKRFQSRLTSLRLKELPEAPEFKFCSTDVTFGVNWTFERAESGDYRAGYLPSGDWPVARAVAASACFPPIFGPMRISAAASEYKRGSYRLQDGDRLRARLELSDGGVYDNLGLEPVWKSHQTVLVSDCGAPFEFSTGKNYLSRLARYTAVLSNQSLALRKRIFFGARSDGKYEGAYWALSSPVDKGRLGYSEETVRVWISRIRTDLDAFSDAEFEILVNHGYSTAADSIREALPDLADNAPAPALPYPDWSDEARVRWALAYSHRRVSPSRWLGVGRSRRGGRGLDWIWRR